MSANDPKRTRLSLAKLTALLPKTKAILHFDWLLLRHLGEGPARSSSSYVPQTASPYVQSINDAMMLNSPAQSSRPRSLP